MSTQVEETKIPSWLADMEFCHVATGGADSVFCGAEPSDGEWLKCEGAGYAGEAICPNCGCPTCPRCAQLAEIAWSLDNS